MESTMALNLSYSHLKRIRLIACFVLFWGTSAAQEFVEIKSIPIEPATLISTDKQGNIYLALENGTIDQYDNAGNLLHHYSPEKLSEATLIEAWNPLKIFIFYRDFQEYIFLDRFLTANNRFSLAEISSYIGLATISADNNIWLIDYSDFSLKKFDVTFQQVTLDRPLDLVLNPDDYDLTFMREYQNLLFIADKSKGILLFDNLGNYLRQVSTNQTDYFSFLEDELYFISDSTIHLINIYNEESRKINLPEPAKYTVLNKTGVLSISDKKIACLDKIE